MILMKVTAIVIIVVGVLLLSCVIEMIIDPPVVKEIVIGIVTGLEIGHI